MILNTDIRSILKSPELGNYELVNPKQISAKGIPLEEEVVKLLNRSKANVLTPGAYPSKL